MADATQARPRTRFLVRLGALTSDGTKVQHCEHVVRAADLESARARVLERVPGAVVLSAAPHVSPHADSPIWLVELFAHGRESEMTVQGANEEEARAFVLQQNPGAKILSIESTER